MNPVLALLMRHVDKTQPRDRVKVGDQEAISFATETDGGAEAAVVLAAHFLALLVDFIGEPFTQRLVRDGWPDASFDA